MRKLFAVISIMLVIAGCSAKKPEAVSQNEREIALAEMRLGETYYRDGNYALALRKLLKAEEMLPKNEFIQNSLGLVYLAKERYSLAQQHFERALALNPEFYAAKNHLGAALMKQKKYEPAIQCFKEISENLLYATPENPITNIGWIYLEKKEYRSAKDYFSKALDIRPCFVIAVHGLASVYIEMIQYDNALKILNRCIKKIPKAAILHSDLAKVYEALREFEKAQAEWKTVLLLAPENSQLAREAEERIIE